MSKVISTVSAVILAGSLGVALGLHIFNDSIVHGQWTQNTEQTTRLAITSITTPQVNVKADLDSKQTFIIKAQHAYSTVRFTVVDKNNQVYCVVNTVGQLNRLCGSN